MTSRWWTYQKERFPLLAHGPLIIIFAVSVMLFSSLQHDEIPDLYRLVGAALSALIFFFQLRVADEHKDFETDARWRPHRAVPRGLVTLPELARLAWIGAAIQFAIAVSVDIGLVPLLLLVWTYIGLMTAEFFVPEWLKQRPSMYLLSHMLVMPMIAFYVSGFDWLCECRSMPAGLGWLMLLAFACGLVLELGRKIRPASLEREGVETYSATWGRSISVSLWLLSVSVAMLAYSLATGFIGSGALPVILEAGVLCIALLVAVLFACHDGQKTTGRLIEPGSGLVAMLLYLGLGPLQLVLHQGGL